MSQSESQDDGEYEVIIVDENNSSILADHDIQSSGPPSTKVIIFLLNITELVKFICLNKNDFFAWIEKISFFSLQIMKLHLFII